MWQCDIIRHTADTSSAFWGTVKSFKFYLSGHLTISLLLFHLSLVISKILFKDQEISLWSTCCRAFFLPFSFALDKYWTRYLSHYQRVGQHFFCIRNGKNVSDFLFVLWIYFLLLSTPYNAFDAFDAFANYFLQRRAWNGIGDGLPHTCQKNMKIPPTAIYRAWHFSMKTRLSDLLIVV